MWGCGLPSPFCMFFIVKGQKTVSIESALKVLACRWQHCKVLEVLNSEVFACSAFPRCLTAHTLHPAPAPSSSGQANIITHSGKTKMERNVIGKKLGFVHFSLCFVISLTIWYICNFDLRFS